MTTSSTRPAARRLDAVRAWTTFVEHGDARRAVVRPEILAQLERSGAAIAPDVDRGAAGRRGRDRGVLAGLAAQIAVERVEDELRRTAEDGDLVLAVTDAETRILWTYGGRVMRRKAEIGELRGRRPLGRRASVGTNALDLANRLGRPAMVFSAEHYAPIVHNWVCWAAPVHDPVTGAQLGVHRPLDDLGPHPPDRARHRAGAGPADRDGDAALAPHPDASRAGDRPTRRRRAGADAARHRRGPARRPAAAAQPAADRDARAARAAPRGALAGAAPRDASTATRRSPLDAQGRGVPPARRARRPARLAPLPAD